MMAEAAPENGMPKYPSPEYILGNEMQTLEDLFGPEKMKRILCTMRRVTDLMAGLDSADAANTITELRKAVMDLAASYKKLLETKLQSQSREVLEVKKPPRTDAGEVPPLSEENNISEKTTAESNHTQSLDVTPTEKVINDNESKLQTPQIAGRKRKREGSADQEGSGNEMNWARAIRRSSRSESRSRGSRSKSSSRNGSRSSRNSSSSRDSSRSSRSNSTTSKDRSRSSRSKSNSRDRSRSSGIELSSERDSECYYISSGEENSSEKEKQLYNKTGSPEEIDSELPWIKPLSKLDSVNPNDLLSLFANRRGRKGQVRGARGARGGRGSRGPRTTSGREESPPPGSTRAWEPTDILGEVLQSARERAEKLKNMQPVTDEVDDDEMGVAATYADYMPAKLKFGCKHPDPVVETASLSSVDPIDVTYKLSLPEETTGDATPPAQPGSQPEPVQAKISALQIEAVVYACQAHEKLLPDNTRAGFLIGDGAGVGKGRTVAAIIYENWLKGRKRAIWVSVSNDLKYDAERDLMDIGATDIPVYPLNQFTYHQKIDADGVVFSTYSSLIGKTSRVDSTYKKRHDQLVAFFGENFDGCIVFDECHKAKNLCPVGSGKASKTGLAVLKLQNSLPNARVVYASATGASEPRNMAYMVRLGIWGEGTPFPTFPDFMGAVQKRGVGAMEIVAMDMKLRGMYIARQLSFHGVTFKIEEVPLSDAFKETYDKSVALWVQALDNFDMALGMICVIPKRKKAIWGQFWSAHQCFFKHLCISAKVDRAVSLAREAVAEGKCVVIGLQSTGEAGTLAQLDRNDGDIREFVSAAKCVFQRLVEKHFPVDEINDDDIENKETFIPMQVELLNSIEELGKNLPTNALDQLVKDLGGPNMVAEMTGRKVRIIQTPEGNIQYQNRAEDGIPLEVLNLAEKRRFMEGEKLIAIISEAASIGISLQSDKRAINQRRRVHITLELPWSADRAIQQFGRTHRSNQVNAPEYIFLISDLAGERRFASTVAKRLESLGALTHGDRRATETRDLSEFNIDNKYGRTTLRAVMDAMKREQTPLVMPPADYNGDFFKDVAAALTNVRLMDSKELERMSIFLNRILGIPVELQNKLFKYFTDTLEEVINHARRCGRFDMGILDLGSAGDCVRRVRCVRFLRRHATGAAPVELHTVHSERGMSWEQALVKYREVTNEPTEGFYLPKTKPRFGNTAVLCVLDPNNKKGKLAKKYTMMQIYKPNTGMLRLETQREVERKYTPLGWRYEEAKTPWRDHHEKSERVCSHKFQFGSCAQEQSCEVGLRIRKLHVLSGSLLAAWSQVEGVLAQRSQMQVVRLKTDQGHKIVGMVIPRSCLEDLRKVLTEDAISVTEQTF